VPQSTNESGHITAPEPIRGSETNNKPLKINKIIFKYYNLLTQNYTSKYFYKITVLPFLAVYSLQMNLKSLQKQETKMLHGTTNAIE